MDDLCHLSLAGVERERQERTDQADHHAAYDGKDNRTFFEWCEDEVYHAEDHFKQDPDDPGDDPDQHRRAQVIDVGRGIVREAEDA